jgi:hypothetical protein
VATTCVVRAGPQTKGRGVGVGEVEEEEDDDDDDEEDILTAAGAQMNVFLRHTRRARAAGCALFMEMRRSRRGQRNLAGPTDFFVRVRVRVRAERTRARKHGA